MPVAARYVNGPPLRHALTVSDIQRFSLHDGPGIRTTVFLKGCNLRCRWCHNPETLDPAPEVRMFPARCVGCGACLEACPRGAHQMTDDGRRFDRSVCVACGACAAECYAGALVLVGQDLSVEDVLAEVLADRAFYDASGGGVTASGGEPLFQLDFVVELLSACKAQGIHTAIETNLAWPWERVSAVLPVTDLVMFDIKLMDPADHRRWTGAGNEQVLDNARRLSAEGLPIIARTPVVEGVNATPEHIGRIADFLRPFGNLLYYELLPYNPLGAGKYESLGRELPCEGLSRPDGQKMAVLAGEARKHGINVRWAGEPVDRRNAG